MRFFKVRVYFFSNMQQKDYFFDHQFCSCITDVLKFPPVWINSTFLKIFLYHFHVLLSVLVALTWTSPVSRLQLYELWDELFCSWLSYSCPTLKRWAFCEPIHFKWTHNFFFNALCIWDEINIGLEGPAPLSSSLFAFSLSSFSSGSSLLSLGMLTFCLLSTTALDSSSNTLFKWV